jgi:hypothetical protein
METDTKKIVGKIHMEVSSLCPSQKDDKDCDIRIHTGMIEVWMRAPNIDQKVRWHNSIADSI